jgi:integrase
MPNGSVIAYHGKRGVVYRIKYRDATGRQVMEAIGPDETQARRVLRNRLTDVDREGYKQPDRISFADFEKRFSAEYLPGRNLKHSTLLSLESVLRCHLLPTFGRVDLTELGRRPELIDRYIAAKTAEGLSPKTIGNHLTTLSAMLKVAMRWRLISTNPVALIERPRLETPEMSVLSETEIGRLLNAYAELEQEADEAERAWWGVTRRLTIVALGTALRRGELLGLAWRDVRLLDGLLTVRQTFVRGRFETPKSRSSKRTIELGPRALEAVGEQWRITAYRSEDDLVFGHPQIGSPLDPSKLTKTYLRTALRHAGITKPFRPWHDLRHTSITHEAAAGNPQAYVQLRAGHSQGAITERYIHAAQVLFPGAAAKGEARTFSEVGGR